MYSGEHELPEEPVFQPPIWLQGKDDEKLHEEGDKGPEEVDPDAEQ